MIFPLTVGELRKALETYDDRAEIWIQGNTAEHPEATPDHFAIEKYDSPMNEHGMVLLAGCYLPESLDAQTRR